MCCGCGVSKAAGHCWAPGMGDTWNCSSSKGVPGSPAGGTQIPTPPPPLAKVGALVTNTALLGKGEGFSTCLSAFLNPGQVLCFSRAHPHSSSSWDAGRGSLMALAMGLL